MKKLIMLLALGCIYCTGLVAQVTPDGMNYQAVARNIKGEVLADQPIALKVTLFSMEEGVRKAHYTELHDIVTSITGVFSVVVGRGKKDAGAFESVPWSNENIWMEISIKSKDQADFLAISNSKLLAVPYAYYAVKSGEVIGKILEGGAGNKSDDFPRCPCEGGLSQIKVLYTGPSGVTINVYAKKDQQDLLVSFNGVATGTILTISATNYPDGKLKDETFFEVMSAGIPMVSLGTQCEYKNDPDRSSLGETVGNFSMLSHRDKKNNDECTVCDIKKEWHVGGNGLMDLCNLLGTKSNTDLILITNNLARLTIEKDGNINIHNSLKVGADLTVNGNVRLNVVNGETINHGMLSVDGPTDLNNSLNVDGISNLNSLLNVNNGSPTLLTGTLRVNGVTDLYNAFNVNNMALSTLSGKLTVNKDALFKDHVLIDNAAYQSTSTTTGALVVNGGLGVGGNLNIGGTSAFGGPVSFAGVVNISDLTQSTTTTNGALIVSGGLGLGKNLNVGGATNLLGNLSVNTNKFTVSSLTGNTTIAGTTAMTGNLSINSNKFTVDALSGNTAIAGFATVGGNFGVSSKFFVTAATGATGMLGDLSVNTNKFLVNAATGNTTVAGTLSIGGATTFNNSIKVTAGTNYIAQFKNTSNANGISIEVGNANPGIANNFITFYKSGGVNVAGRIEGETLTDLRDSDDFKTAREAFILQTVTASVDLTIAGFEVAQAAIGVAAAASSSTACVGFGACITAPIPALIISAGTNLVLKIANVASKAVNLSYAILTRDNWVKGKEAGVGVTYQSGAGDYAEWLPKENLSDKFIPGAIVAIKNGKITLRTDGADKLFVISTKPIVLGNMPEAGKEAGYEKVAFLGQVPVYVIGSVKSGDYIVPSGMANGLGLAISPDKMKPEDYQNIVGVAWSASDNKDGGLVNVAIGLNTGDISKVVAQQSKDIQMLKAKMEETTSMLTKLLAGEKIQPVSGDVHAPAINVKPATVAGSNLNKKKMEMILFIMN